MLANIMLAQIYATITILEIGMDILFEKEHDRLNQLFVHDRMF